MPQKETNRADLVRDYNDKLWLLENAINRGAANNVLRECIAEAQQKRDMIREYDNIMEKRKHRGVVFAFITAALIWALAHGGVATVVDFIVSWVACLLMISIALYAAYSIGIGKTTYESTKLSAADEAFPRYLGFAGWLIFIYCISKIF